MLKPVLAVLLAIPTLVWATPDPVFAAAPARKTPDCQAVFDSNRSRIEDLAAQRKTADIQALFRQAGCAGPAVTLPMGRAPSAAVAVQIRCRFKLLPPSIICTF